MSSAVGCPPDAAAELVAAAGELVGSCANDGMTASVEQKRTVKDREVFMLLILLTRRATVKNSCVGCTGRLGVLDRWAIGSDDNSARRKKGNIENHALDVGRVCAIKW